MSHEKNWGSLFNTDGSPNDAVLLRSVTRDYLGGKYGFGLNLVFHLKTWHSLLMLQTRMHQSELSADLCIIVNCQAL